MSALLLELDGLHETTKEHGDALEAFTRELFASCKLFDNLSFSRVAIGQIDLTCRVKCIPGLVTHDWSPPYLVAECKNVKSAVGFPELAKLVAKMENRTNTGIVIATEGVTGSWDDFTDALGYVREQFLAKGLRILCFVRPDLERIVAGENLLLLLQAKIDSLYFHPRGS